MRLYQPTIEHVAYVDQPASGRSFDVVKGANGSSFEFFFPFEKRTKDGTVAGIAYPVNPNRPDMQGDHALREDVFAMHKSFERHHQLNYMHRRDLTDSEAIVLESTIQPDGSWYLKTRVLDPQLLEEIRSGAIGGFSIGGSCKAGKALVPQNLDEEDRRALIRLVNQTVALRNAVMMEPQPEEETEMTKDEELAVVDVINQTTRLQQLLLDELMAARAAAPAPQLKPRLPVITVLEAERAAYGHDAVPDHEGYSGTVWDSGIENDGLRA